MAKLCDPDIDMITLAGCNEPEPSIRHMIYMYYDRAGMGSQQSREFTEELLLKNDAICQNSLNPKSHSKEQGDG